MSNDSSFCDDNAKSTPLSVATTKGIVQLVQLYLWDTATTTHPNKRLWDSAVSRAQHKIPRKGIVIRDAVSEVVSLTSTIDELIVYAHAALTDQRYYRGCDFVLGGKKTN